MSRNRIQPIRGTQWLTRHHKRETPEYVARMHIAGANRYWRLVGITKVSYTCVVPTNSGIVPCNYKQIKNAQFFGRDGLSIVFPDGLGRKMLGRPSKVKKEYQLRVDIRGYDKEWVLLEILSGWRLPDMKEMSDWDLSQAGFEDYQDRRIIIEDGLGVPLNRRRDGVVFGSL